MQQGPGGVHRGPAGTLPNWTSVARLLRTAAIGRTSGRRQLPVALCRAEAAPLGALLQLDLRGLLDRLEEAADRPACPTDVVHPLRHRSAAIGQRAVAVAVDRAQGLVHLDELAGGQPTDDAGLDAVLQDLAVVLLQAQTDAVRGDVDDRWEDHDADAADPGHRVEADVELVGD